MKDLLILVLLVGCWSLDAQISNDSLVVLEDQMISGETPDDREAAFVLFSEELSQRLSQARSFRDSLSFLKSLAIQYGSEGSFRILTAQCPITRDRHRHFGVLQTPDTLYRLVDLSDDVGAYDNRQFQANAWPGALYYGIHEFKLEGNHMYLLFGYDSHSLASDRKVIEVLTFDTTGAPQFGAPLFVYEDETVKHRVILQYSGEVPIRLQYNHELDLIIFDHLIPMKSLYADEGIVMVGDGSYEGFRWSDDRWTHVSKVFHQISLQPTGKGLPVDRKKLFKQKQ